MTMENPWFARYFKSHQKVAREVFFRTLIFKLLYVLIKLEFNNLLKIWSNVSHVTSLPVLTCRAVTSAATTSARYFFSRARASAATIQN